MKRRITDVRVSKFVSLDGFYWKESINHFLDDLINKTKEEHHHPEISFADSNNHVTLRLIEDKGAYQISCDDPEHFQTVKPEQISMRAGADKMSIESSLRIFIEYDSLQTLLIVTSGDYDLLLTKEGSQLAIGLIPLTPIK